MDAPFVAPVETDPDQEARRTLARHKTFATGLLVLMAAVMLASYALPSGFMAAMLQAAAKAGFVGGIADWFAVTALFRHPLGLPIPHTAIIPAQRVRLGQALGRFVGRHVFTEGEVRRVSRPTGSGRYRRPLLFGPGRHAARGRTRCSR